MVSKKIILLNGPPRSGKDTIAEMIGQAFAYDVLIEKFAKPLKNTAPVLYNIPSSEWCNFYDTTENKDVPFDCFLGLSARQVQIHISETLMKPVHGPHVFGHLLAQRLDKCLTKNIIVSDSGFTAEAEVIVEHYGAENVELWQIHRDGCDYSSDSRGYIDLNHLNVDTIKIDNNGSLEDLNNVCLDLFKRFCYESV